MGRAHASVALLLVLGGCHRATRDGAGDGGTGRAEAAASPTTALLARPIAAARAPSGTVMVAGFAPLRGVVVTDIGDDGSTRWTVDAFPGVSGTNAELSVFPATEGVVVVYRGRRGSAEIREAVVVDASGHLVGSTLKAGTVACSTDRALAWIERAEDGASRVMSASWGQAPAALFSVPADRDPALGCGKRAVFALGDGDQDTTVTASGVASARARVALRDRDFGDEEREHESFVVGDTLRLVRVGRSGSVAVRDVDVDLAPWRRATTRLGDADDVVAVDGDDGGTMIVTTRDDASDCDGAAASSVHVLRIPKVGAERSFELAGAACDRSAGPFWTGSVQGAFVVGWPERSGASGAGSPPVVGLAFRVIDEAGQSASPDGGGADRAQLRRIARPADAIVDAGCDAHRCYAVALVRPAGAAEGDPGAVAILAYP